MLLTARALPALSRRIVFTPLFARALSTTRTNMSDVPRVQLNDGNLIPQVAFGEYERRSEDEEERGSSGVGQVSRTLCAGQLGSRSCSHRSGKHLGCDHSYAAQSSSDPLIVTTNSWGLVIPR